jgi:hypothetical protein
VTDDCTAENCLENRTGDWEDWVENHTREVEQFGERRDNGNCQDFDEVESESAFTVNTGWRDDFRHIRSILRDAKLSRLQWHMIVREIIKLYHRVRDADEVPFREFYSFEQLPFLSVPTVLLLADAVEEATFSIRAEYMHGCDANGVSQAGPTDNDIDFLVDFDCEH